VSAPPETPPGFWDVWSSATRCWFVVERRFIRNQRLLFQCTQKNAMKLTMWMLQDALEIDLEN
jgi:hypothetical protein